VRVLAVCHDAGGAELVSSWARGRDDVECVLDGPAVRVFAAKLGVAGGRVLPPLAGFDLVLCGSSGNADLEQRAVRAARAAGVRCAVWLDHWTGYAERFVLDGERVLPDEVWVADEHAEQLAREQLPGADVRLHGNPFLAEVARAVAACDDDGGERRGRVLYACEPTAQAAARVTGDPRGWGYTEHEALERCLAALDGVAVRVRLHPAEAPGKYDAVVAAHADRLPIEISSGGPLAEDCAWADTVIGCDTMAMVVGLAAGRRVLTALPPGARPLSLPFPEIERLHAA